MECQKQLGIWTIQNYQPILFLTITISFKKKKNHSQVKQTNKQTHLNPEPPFQKDYKKKKKPNNKKAPSKCVQINLEVLKFFSLCWAMPAPIQAHSNPAIFSVPRQLIRFDGKKKKNQECLNFPMSSLKSDFAFVQVNTHFSLCQPCCKHRLLHFSQPRCLQSEHELPVLIISFYAILWSLTSRFSRKAI